jgi:hypothetical protein
MWSPSRRLLLALFCSSTILLLLGSDFSVQAGGDDMVVNPYYRFWANSKKGASAVHLEKNKVAGAEEDEKVITYKVLEINDKQVVVQAVVKEKEYFGHIESAPTKHTYPAKIKKSHLEKFLLDTGVTKGEDTVKFKEKDMKCITVAGTIKGSGGEETKYKMWLSEEIPGGIVKQIRTTSNKGNLVAETTTMLQSFKAAD